MAVININSTDDWASTTLNGVSVGQEVAFAVSRLEQLFAEYHSGVFTTVFASSGSLTVGLISGEQMTLAGNGLGNPAGALIVAFDCNSPGTDVSFIGVGDGFGSDNFVTLSQTRGGHTVTLNGSFFYNYDSHAFSGTLDSASLTTDAGDSLTITGTATIGGSGATPTISGTNTAYTVISLGDIEIDSDLTTLGNQLVTSTTGAVTLINHVNNDPGITVSVYTGGNDVLTGGDSADLLSGYDGNDTLKGNGGNDTLDGGAGKDSMVGGDGDDLYIVDAALDRILERPHGGSDTVQSSITYSLANQLQLENLTLTGTAAAGNGNALANWLEGNDAANRLHGYAGDDTVLGAGGRDTMFGDAGHDSMDGGGGADILVGGAGNDTLDGGAGADTMRGETGNDLYVVDDLGDRVIDRSGRDVVDAQISGVTLADGIEELRMLVAGSGYGNGGANILTSAGDLNTFYGGAGNDTYNVQGDDQVVETARGGTRDVVMLLSAAGGAYTLAANVENLTVSGSFSGDVAGNELANLLIGGALADNLSGGAARDTLTGGAGDDTLAGGAGNDSLGGGAGSDVAVLSGNFSEYTLTDRHNGTYVLSHSGGSHADGSDTVSGIEFFNFADAQHVSLAEVFTGQLAGGGGGDDGGGGGSGEPLLFGPIFGGSEFVHGGSPPVTGVSMTGGLGDSSLVGSNGDDQLFDQNGNDTLIGGQGRDWLGGGTGNDSMVGGVGDDRYEVDSPGDVVVELPRDGVDQVTTTLATYTMPDNVEFLVFANEIDHVGTGTALKDYMSGHNGNDLLRGLAGDDEIGGAGGNDTLIGDAGNDVLRGDAGNDSIDGGDGWDVMYLVGARSDFRFTDMHNGTVVVTHLGGPYPQGNDTVTGCEYFFFQSLTGNGSQQISLSEVLGGPTPPWPLAPALPPSQSLFGSGGADSLAGGDNRDTISGGAGNDTIDGGGGSDLLTGGAGADYFYIYLDGYWKTDHITDFTPGVDKLVLAHQSFDGLLLGPLADQYFGTGTSFGSDDRILYVNTDQSSFPGQIWYDSNNGTGGGGGAEGPVVVLDGMPAIHASDILVL